jgi:hypothetical protein
LFERDCEVSVPTKVVVASGKVNVLEEVKPEADKTKFPIVNGEVLKVPVPEATKLPALLTVKTSAVSPVFLITKRFPEVDFFNVKPAKIGVAPV